MKNLLFLFVLFISLSSIAQELIYDKVITTENYSLPLYLNSTDSSMFLLNKTESRFRINTLDVNGNLTLDTNLVYSYTPDSYLITPHNVNFVTTDSNAYLLSVESIQCDYALPEVKIIKFNKFNNTIESKTLDFHTEFSVNPELFKTYISSSINENKLLLYTNKRLLKFDLNLATTDSIIMNLDSVSHIIQLGNQNYSLIKNDSVYTYNSSNSLQNTIGFPDRITHTEKINNDSLVIATTSTIYLVDENYTILNQYNTNSNGIEIKANKIWVNYALPNQETTLYEFSKNLSLINSFTFPNNKIIKNPIVSVNEDRTVCLVTTNSLSNNLFNSRYLKYNLDNSAIQNSHLDIELTNVIINSTDVFHYNPAQAPNHHTYHINPNISVQIQNNSTDTIKELYVQSTRSTRQGSSFCVGHFFIKHFELSLAPNSSTTLLVGSIGTSADASNLTEADASGLISHDFCVNILAPNMEVDTDISNNRLCETTTAYVSIKENTNVEFSVYPNPTSSRLTIKSNEKVLAYRLLNIEGKTVLNDLQPSTLKINVRNLDRGIYFLEVTTKSGIGTEKVVVQ